MNLLSALGETHTDYAGSPGYAAGYVAAAAAAAGYNVLLTVLCQGDLTLIVAPQKYFCRLFR